MDKRRYITYKNSESITSFSNSSIWSYKHHVDFATLYVIAFFSFFQGQIVSAPLRSCLWNLSTLSIAVLSTKSSTSNVTANSSQNFLLQMRIFSLQTHMSAAEHMHHILSVLAEYRSSKRQNQELEPK